MFLSNWLKKEKSLLKLQTNVKIDTDQPLSATDSAFGEDLIRIDFISELPFELACYIMSFISPIEAQFVSKSWNRVCNDNSIWKQAYFRAWGVPPRYNPLIFKDWKLLCRNRRALKSNWDEGKVEARVLDGHMDSVYCLQFDSQKIISGSRDHTIKIWSMKTNQCLETLRYHTGSVLCLQYDRNHLISGSSDCLIVVWDLHTLQPLRVLSGHTAPVLDVRITGQYVLSASKDCTIKIWDLETGELVKNVEGHSAAVNSLHVHENTFVSASGDGEIRLWEIPSGELLRTYKGHSRGLACVQYDGKMIVSGSSDNSIKIWNARTGECLKTLEYHKKLVRTLALDDEHIVSGSYDQTIKVYSAKNGDLLLDLAHAHRSWIFHVQVDPARIVSAAQVFIFNQDFRIIIWDFSGGLDVSDFCP